MIGKGRAALIVAAVAAMVASPRSSDAGSLIWHLSGTISSVSDPLGAVGVSVGSPWFASITFDPNTPPQYTPGATYFVDDSGGATHEIDVSSGTLTAVGYTDPTAPAHAAVISQVQLDPNGPALWNELSFGNDVESFSGAVDLGLGLARVSFQMSTGTDYFSPDHLPTSPPDLALGSGTIEIDGFGGVSFVVDGVVTRVVPEPPAAALLALCAALLAMHRQPRSRREL